MQPEETIVNSKNKPNFSHVIFGAIVIGYLILLFLLYRVDTSVVVSVVTFDILFVSLLFPLRGSLLSKTLLLFAGNMVGFVWNLLHLQLADTFAYFLGDVFSVFFSLASIMVNCVWIVSLWSLGLSILARQNLKRQE